MQQTPIPQFLPPFYIARAAIAFGSYYKVGDVHARWDSYSDVNQDEQVNIVDIAGMSFGWEAPAWTPS